MPKQKPTAKSLKSKQILQTAKTTDDTSQNAVKRRGRPPKPKPDPSLIPPKQDRIGDFIVPIIDQDKGTLQSRTRKNKRSPERIKQINQRIEECRGLMCLMMSRGDICRTLARAWGISSKSVDRYYDEARKRQLQILDATPEELKGNSLSFWTNKLRIAEAQRSKAQKSIDDGMEFAKHARQSITKIDTRDIEALKQLDSIIKRAQKMIQAGQQGVASAEHTARGIQDRIDRLVGNLAPERINLVNSKGEDLPISEPVTKVDVIQNIINVIKGKASGYDASVIETAIAQEVPKLEIPIEYCDESENNDT